MAWWVGEECQHRRVRKESVRCAVRAAMCASRLQAADGPPNADKPSSNDAPIFRDSALPSLSGTSTDVSQASSSCAEAGNHASTPRANSEPERLPETVPIDEVEALAAYTCPICFSSPSHATITPCGHVLCGECLFTAVKTAIQRGAYTLPPGERMIARYALTYAPLLDQH